ncbi:MAG: DegT/DnrJ/EryC1/StrS aminotransferase family protein [Elusimicrobia bacterium]|nr:DegT/DnrJ/EryC1/StrS aminotransferase family protein [Elusimicrobiota bacterium]
MSRDLVLSVYRPPRARTPWRLEALLGLPCARHYSLGRWALAEALRLAGAGPGRPVLWPGYICREVLAAGAAAGAPPLYYALDASLRPAADPADWPAAAAVVAVDYFGFPQDLAPFEAFCRRTGAVLIEDAAHALLGREPAGRWLGARAPLGVFSPRKTLPIPDGGTLAVLDPALAARVQAQAPARARGRGKRALLRAAAPWLGPRTTLRALALARSVRRGMSGSELPPPDPDGERRIAVGPEPCAELAAPIVSLDHAADAARRKALYAVCARLLAPAGVAPVFGSMPEGTVPYLYPFRASGAQAEAAERLLRREGLASLPWPDLPEAVAPAAPSHYRDVRGVHFLW